MIRDFFCFMVLGLNNRVEGDVEVLSFAGLDVEGGNCFGMVSGGFD